VRLDEGEVWKNVAWKYNIKF